MNQNDIIAGQKYISTKTPYRWIGVNIINLGGKFQKGLVTEDFILCGGPSGDCSHLSDLIEADDDWNPKDRTYTFDELLHSAPAGRYHATSEEHMGYHNLTVVINNMQRAVMWGGTLADDSWAKYTFEKIS